MVLSGDNERSVSIVSDTMRLPDDFRENRGRLN